MKPNQLLSIKYNCLTYYYKSYFYLGFIMNRIVLVIIFCTTVFFGCGGEDNVENNEQNNSSTILDSDIGVTWQKSHSNEELSWNEAYEYCDNLELEGITDWTLPIKEYFYYLFEGCQDSVLNEGDGFCDSCFEIANDGTGKLSAKCMSMFPEDNNMYWTKNDCSFADDKSWFVSFKIGLISYSFKTSKLYVRCVRKKDN